MLEIIKRHEGEMSQKEQITGAEVQICYNSWGHLSIRIIKDPTQDVLIVLDERTSNAVMNFCERIVPKNLLARALQAKDELPF